MRNRFSYLLFPVPVASMLFYQTLFLIFDGPVSPSTYPPTPGPQQEEGLPFQADESVGLHKHSVGQLCFLGGS